MARTFRLWQKKRGGRRTGSRLAGSLGEAVFFGILFLLGAISLTAVLTSQVMNPTPEIYRFGFGFWLMVLVMASFALIGGIGVVWSAVYAGTSAERRSALVKHAVGMELISEAMPTSLEFPNIPRDAYLTNSPGVKLKYRLPTEQAPVWRLAVSALIFLVSTGVTSVLIVILVNQHMAGTPDWFLTLFAAPLILANLWCVRYFFSELRRQTRFGPTCIEISNHPLRPNSECEIFVTQAGRLSLKSLVLSLVCEEEATYSQGTDIRTETRVVSRQEVLHQDATRIEDGAPLECSGVLAVPEHVMHSLQSGHNAVRWRLVVVAKSERSGTMRRSFPVIVYPTLSQQLNNANHG
ncbi:MAG: hypothetical protein H6822_26545 [Planctomycetaceae bacterium]|nr:hypothetical protein [Planctomycetales bacterium]MCB9925738.1 hypothetical protein [Planctomycetaceae bacterium]